MVIGQRLREIREMKSLTQGDIEDRTGLLRCYLSRVENGHTVPSLDTLEKLARAFEVPLYQIFFTDGRKLTKTQAVNPQDVPRLPRRDRVMITELAGMFRSMTAQEKVLVLSLARKFSAKKKEE
jgi:transcriptional regulator with XRE-family HTH domain